MNGFIAMVFLAIMGLIAIAPIHGEPKYGDQIVMQQESDNDNN